MAGVELDRCARGHEVSNQQSEKKTFPNTDRLGKTGRYLQLRSFTFVAPHDLYSGGLSQSCDSYAAAFCCRDVGPNGPNNKHSLEEHLWHVASTTSTAASLPVARLEFPSQAKLPLRDGWHRTPKLCHCS